MGAIRLQKAPVQPAQPQRPSVTTGRAVRPTTRAMHVERPIGSEFRVPRPMPGTPTMEPTAPTPPAPQPTPAISQPTSPWTPWLSLLGRRIPFIAAAVTIYEMDRSIKVETAQAQRQVEWLPGPCLDPKQWEDADAVTREMERRFAHMSTQDLQLLREIRRRQTYIGDHRITITDDDSELEIPLPGKLTAYLQMLDRQKNGDDSIEERAKDELALIELDLTRRSWDDIQKSALNLDIEQLESEILQLIASGKISEAQKKQLELDALREQLSPPKNSPGGPLQIRASAAGSASDPAPDTSTPPDGIDIIGDGLPDDISFNDIGDIFYRILDGKASITDMATLLATSPGSVVTLLNIYYTRLLEDEPDNLLVNLLNDPFIATDGKIILTILINQHSGDRSDRDRRISEAMDAAEVHDSELHTENPDQMIINYSLFVEHIRVVFLELVPNANQILALVDAHLQAHAQRIARLQGVLDMGALKQELTHKQSPTPEASLSLLFHGVDIARWFSMEYLMRRESGENAHIISNTRVLLRNTNFTPHQLGMIVDLFKTSYTLMATIQHDVTPYLQSDPDIADQNLRELYTANKPMGGYILAEYDRRMNLPEARVQRALDEAFTEGDRNRRWRKATTLQSDMFKAIIQRALMYAGTGNMDQLRTLAARWIDVVAQDPKVIKAKMQPYGPEQDQDGFHAFTILNAHGYNAQVDPFGFLLPHEHQFWDQPFSTEHRSVRLIHQIGHVVGKGDFREVYDYFSDKEGFDEGNTAIRKAAQGQIPGVSTDAMHELMRRAALNSELHVALMAWAISEPQNPDQHATWAAIPSQVADLLQYARRRKSTIAGNVLELVMRSANYDGTAELHAVQYYARDRDSWVRLLPIDFIHRRQIADLLVIGRTGTPQLVEVKNKRVHNDKDFEDLKTSIDKAASQLAESRKGFPTADQVIYLRLVVASDRAVIPTRIDNWLRENLANAPQYGRLKEITVEVTSSNTGSTTTVTYANPRYTPAARIKDSVQLAGPREARLLTDRLIAMGMLAPERHSTILGRLASAPAEAVRRVRLMPTAARMLEAIKRYNLQPQLNGYVTAP